MIIRDRPPPIQRRGRGIHPYFKTLLDHARLDGEEIRPLHRGRGRIPCSTFLAVSPTTGATRLLLTLRWKDDDPNAHMTTITEVLPDDGLADVVNAKLKDILSA